MRNAYAAIHDATTAVDGLSAYDAVGYYMGRSLVAAAVDLDCLGPLHERYLWAHYPKQWVNQGLLE